MTTKTIDKEMASVEATPSGLAQPKNTGDE